MCSSAQNLSITTQMQRIAGVTTVVAGGARWVTGGRQWLGREKDERGRDRLEWKGTQLSFPVDDVSRHHYFKQYLYVDLGVLASFWDKVFEQQKVFSDLKKNIENLEKNSVTSLRTLVNLGSEVYMQADVPDTRRIFVDIGLGFHVEFTWSEALNYIARREEKLARQIEDYTRLIASIKAQIKMVCEGIRELLQLPEEGSY
ncbi:hypothetical protein RHGRI_033837 [Rhododendron griersonianum]|uniref:Uncharacterized protein n=1 Tax=Rhododendron griersonianum TaxID=479676 RepID=A0AAV6I406_9ERIC|nr:hypothetical protein RHGRI_033837 [Rhododendron griersonianum]